MASAGEYSPIPTPFFWYPEYMNTIKMFFPDFVFKCQDVSYISAKDSVRQQGGRGSEFIKHSWSYASESALKLSSLLVSGSNKSVKYTHNRSNIVYITYEPVMFMDGWITGVIMCSNSTLKCKRTATNKCKCEACMSAIQISIHYWPLSFNPNDILTALEVDYFCAQKMFASNIGFDDLQIRKETNDIQHNQRLKVPKQDSVRQQNKPYYVGKINIPENMLVKEDEYFIQSWME